MPRQALHVAITTGPQDNEATQHDTTSRTRKEDLQSAQNSLKPPQTHHMMSSQEKERRSLKQIRLE
jgi:hypothetical protein